MRILYIENALKNHDIRKAVCLANCFVNKYAINCKYPGVLEKEIEKNCPTIFKNELRVPDFYLKIIKSYISK